MTGRPRSGRRRHDREIARLAVPALGALVAEPLYVLADTAIVGNIGTDELAGLAIAASALLTGYAVFIFLAYGSTAAVSRLLGAGRPQDAATQAVQGLYLAAGIGLSLVVIVIAASEPILRALGADGGVLGPARTYLEISALGIPAHLLMLAGVGYLRGLQDTRTPLVVAGCSAIANLVLEVVLIEGFGFGIGASAASTVVAQCGAAVVYVRIVVRAADGLGAVVRPDRRVILALARTGGDLLVRTLALRGSLTLLTAVAARVGTVDVAAHEVAFAVWSLLALALDAIAIAAQALVGRYLGAGDTDGAREVGRRMLEIGVGGGVVLGVAVLLVRHPLASVFSDDPRVVSLATFLLLIAALLQPVNAVAFVLDGLLIGAGDMRFLAFAMVGSALVIVPAALTVAVAGLGIGWVWATVALLMCSRASVLSLRWRSGRWAVTGAVR